VGRVKRACLVSAILTMLAVTLAGCGGGGKTAFHQSASRSVTTPHETAALGKVGYDRTMKRLGRQLAGSVQHLFPLVEAQPGSDLRGDSGKAREDASRRHDRDREGRPIVPPGPIRAEHRGLLQGISALGGELDKLIHVEEKASSQAFGLYARFMSLRTIAKARTAIEKKGYAIG
jgi:hypothetical protein